MLYIASQYSAQIVEGGRGDGFVFAQLVNGGAGDPMVVDKGVG